MKKQLILSITLPILIGFVFINTQKASLITTEQAIELEEAVIPHQIYVPMIAKGLQAKFWTPVRLGAEKAARDYGAQITFEGPVEERQTEEQLRYLQTAINKHPEAIVLSAIDSRAATPYLEQAQERGIPVIGFDSGVDSPIVKTTVGTDNYGAGALAAVKMGELLDKKGKVAMIIQDETSKVATDRRDGFVETIEQQYPNMSVVVIGYGGGDIQESTEIAKKILQENPDLEGIFGGNEGSAEGVVKGIRELNKEGSITAIGFDSGKIILDAIREGIIAGAVTQHPQDIGYKAVEAAVRAYKGEPQPEFIDTGFTWYDKSNIDSPEIKSFLYE